MILKTVTAVRTGSSLRVRSGAIGFDVRILDWVCTRARLVLGDDAEEIQFYLATGFHRDHNFQGGINHGAAYEPELESLVHRQTGISRKPGFPRVSPRMPALDYKMKAWPPTSLY
jgi:hypothetical protein